MLSYIKAISYYLPPDKYTNAEYFKDFPELAGNSNLEKIGVEERRFVQPEVTASDIGFLAAEKLFNEHPIDRTEIDFVMFCSIEFDYLIPATSSILQERLKLSTNCGTLDLVVGCSGFVYALGIAKGFIESNICKNILIINSSTLTKEIHKKDKGSRFIFGDGASATIVSGRESKWGIGQFVLGNDGKRFDKIIIKDRGARNPIKPGSKEDFSDDFGNITNDASFFMNGTSIFNFALKTVPKMVAETVAKNNFKIEEIDLFIFHQANIFLIETIRKKLNLPEDKVFNYMSTVGNTVSSTIPIVLYEAQKVNRIKEGDKIVLAAFGVGLTWGATVIQI